MPVNLICINCQSTYSVVTARKDSSKYCSKKCKWDFNKWSSNSNVKCTQCQLDFHLKPSHKSKYKRTHGYFCSVACYAKFKSLGVYNGAKNPNYRARTEDFDGYKLREYTSEVIGDNGRRQKLHMAVCFSHFNIESIPKGFHIHHRDCNVHNNSPENLAILSISDHIWLHKQFGNATLWAMFHGKIEINTICEWSDNKQRASILLGKSILNQSIDEFNSISETVRGADGFGSTDAVK